MELLNFAPLRDSRIVIILFSQGSVCDAEVQVSRQQANNSERLMDGTSCWWRSQDGEEEEKDEEVAIYATKVHRRVSGGWKSGAIKFLGNFETMMRVDG